MHVRACYLVLTLDCDTGKQWPSCEAAYYQYRKRTAAVHVHVLLELELGAMQLWARALPNFSFANSSSAESGFDAYLALQS